MRDEKCSWNEKSAKPFQTPMLITMLTGIFWKFQEILWVIKFTRLKTVWEVGKGRLWRRKEIVSANSLISSTYTLIK